MAWPALVDQVVAAGDLPAGVALASAPLGLDDGVEVGAGRGVAEVVGEHADAVPGEVFGAFGDEEVQDLVGIIAAAGHAEVPDLAHRARDSRLVVQQAEGVVPTALQPGAQRV